MRIVSRIARTVLAAGILLLGACDTNPYRWDNSVGKTIDESMARDAKAAKPAVPADVSQALLPSLDGGTAPVAEPREPRFDLTVNNAPVRQVLLGMVEGTPYSILLHPDTNGLVTLHLKAVTVPEAMEAIRQVYGHDYRRDGNRFSMLGRGMQSRIFPVNYLNLERHGRSDTRIVTGELTQSATTGGATGTTPTTGTTQTSRTQRPPGGVRVETESKVEFWKDLRESLVAIIGTANGRHVIVNPQAGVVLVRAMPDELRMVEEYLGITQSTINRQVILEAKIIEVELNDGYQTGINWAAVSGNSTFGMVGGGTVFNGSGKSEIAGNTGNLNPGSLFSAISGTNASAFGGVFSAAIKNADFAAFLELLKSQGNVHVLSSPRVSTVNNQKAVIKVGGDEFFVTSVTGGSPASLGVAATMPTINLTPFFSGIALDVMPQIDDAQNIILHIHPSVSEVTQNNKTFKVADQDFILPLAASAIQESDNVVRASNGQVIVIGGLMKEGSTDENAGIPLLGDIPIVGNAFKHKRVVRIKKELVILLKPTIVDLGQVWENAVKESQGRIGNLKR